MKLLDSVKNGVAILILLSTASRGVQNRPEIYPTV